MEENKTQGEEVKVEKVVSEEQQNSQGSSSSKKADPADVEKNKMMAILSYFLFFLPLITDAKDSEFAKFHANQGLVLLIAGSVVSFIILPIIIAILSIATLGLFLLVSPVLYSIGSLVLIVFVILGMINANNGEMKRLPLIGGIDIIK
ncbi:MAG: DUF4870 domain-containing protein [Candidatus Moranbacteria bacterium]|nr:DUF4870 domain-containing protein [Candidatus Moranbacteria bacterium]